MEVRSVEAIIRALNDANVKYLIVGGLAVNAYGYERLTRDVDLVIGLEPENIIRGLRALIGIGYQLSIPIQPEQFADERLRQEWRRDKDMIVLKLWSDRHRRTPVDVFVYEPFDFSREYTQARQEVVAGELTAPILSYQALLEMKRASGRDRDLIDVQQLQKLDPYR
jgi:hypothetical protein